ncbi:Hypothetical protein EPM1_0835 [Stenotrophomonas maltophilia EPM1]|nr:Hypothetical protein EPM1_0835 [Stenotrophomonas maltophilia EPM1]
MIFGGITGLPASGGHYRVSIVGGSPWNRRSHAFPSAGHRLAQQRVRIPVVPAAGRHLMIFGGIARLPASGRHYRVWIFGGSP